MISRSALTFLILLYSKLCIAQVDYAYMAIHLDPSNLAKDPINQKPNTQRAGQYWQALSSFVNLADHSGSHKLTLMFTAQWAQYVLSDGCLEYPQTLTYRESTYTNCLDLVQAWETQGHEIAFHHHQHGAPAAWDGFSDSTDDTVVNDSNYLGTVDDMMNYIKPLSTSGNITSGTSGEWFRDGLTYAAGGYDESHFLTNPSCLYSDGHFIWQIGMRHYLSEASQQSVLSQINGISVGELPDALTQSSEERIIGFVSHASNIAELGEKNYKLLFNYLNSKNIILQPLTDISNAFSNGLSPAPEQNDCYNEEAEYIFSAMSLAQNFQISNSDTLFSGGISTDSTSYSQQLQIDAQTDINVTLKVHPKTDLNQTAEQIIVAAYQPENSSETKWFQYNAAQNWHHWDGQLNSLNGDQISILQDSLLIDIFQGNLAGLLGEVLIYAGYQLNTEEIIINSRPITINIGQ